MEDSSTKSQAYTTPDPETLRAEIPEAMQRARRWLCWKLVQKKQGEKPAKVPVYATGGMRTKTDTPEDYAQLVDMETAIQAMEARHYAGIGFALGPDDDGAHWQGIDLDNTDSDERLQSLVDLLPGYVERSPSGTGYHAIGKGRPFKTLGANDSGIEAYARGRFFTVTGEAVGGDIEDLADFVEKTLRPLHSPNSDADTAQGRGKRHRQGAADPYAARAFDSAIAAIATAKEGHRNDTLNREAHGLFGLVLAGRLDRDQVVAALEAAARGIGLAEAEIKATLRSAWEAAQPRHDGEPVEEAEDKAGPVAAHLAQALGIDVTAADLGAPRPEVLARVRTRLDERARQGRDEAATARRAFVEAAGGLGLNRRERRALFAMIRKHLKGAPLLDRELAAIRMPKRELRGLVATLAGQWRDVQHKAAAAAEWRTTSEAAEWQRMVEMAREAVQKAAADAQEQRPITVAGHIWPQPPETGTHVRTAPPKDEERPCFGCYLNWWELHGRKMRPGIWYHGLKEQKGDNPPLPFDEWLCSPLLIAATTRDANRGNFGRLLWYRVEGRWKFWNMPMALLGGDGTDVRRELLREGVLLSPRNRHRLLDYLTAIEPQRKFSAALEVGWHGDAFVLPDEVFGADDIHFQSEHPLTTDFTTAGTLADWQRDVAALAVENPPLAVAIAAAFAGPLLGRVHLRFGGLHYLGPSSCGKTTALEAAASVWGGPAFVRTWHATANGLEAAAAEHNDLLLVLDEIGEANARDVGNVVYALGNGIGKSRAVVTGHAKAVRRWQTILLSSGEKSLAAVVAEGGGKVMAGQELRLLSVPVDGFRYGAFDHLHGHASGRHLADAIKTAVQHHHGHAGRAWLRWLVENPDRDFAGELKAITDKHFQNDHGQEGRAASVFALIALAGELAIEAGILPWPAETAVEAAKTLYARWQEHRGEGPAELRQAVEAIQGFIARYRDRFEDLDESVEQRRTILDRAGWKKGDKWCFIPTVFAEAIGGMDPTQAKRMLKKAGILKTNQPRELNARERVGPKQTKTVVCILESALESAFVTRNTRNTRNAQGAPMDSGVTGADSEPVTPVTEPPTPATEPPAADGRYGCYGYDTATRNARNASKNVAVTGVTAVTGTEDGTEGDFKKTHAPDFTGLVDDEADRLDGRDIGEI